MTETQQVILESCQRLKREVDANGFAAINGSTYKDKLGNLWVRFVRLLEMAGDGEPSED